MRPPANFIALRIGSTAVVSELLLVMAPQAMAHHSAAPHFDLEKTIGVHEIVQGNDTITLKTPFTGWDVMEVSSEPYVPYNCVELSGKNNIRPRP